MMLNLMGYFLLVLFILISVAFLTLLERKVLSFIQNRKGPNKVGIIGIFQPFADALKLFTKEFGVIINSSEKVFFFSSISSLLILFLLLLTYMFYTNIYFLNYSILLIIIILSLNSYVIMMMGWSSGSIYSLIGSIRAIAQMLSYEVSFIMIILVPMILGESSSLMDLLKWQYYMWFLWMMIPLFMIFFISVLAELNRSPFDFIEGESELVSGFNVEYYSGSFAFIFMGEYGMIIYLSMFMMWMFMASSKNFLMVMMILGMVVLMVIYMRGILPRMRYDELMYLCWKIILPLILNYLMFFLMFKIYLSLES